MILQALCSFYGRAKNDPALHVSEPGYAMAGVDGEIVLDKDGNVVSANPLPGPAGGKKHARRQMEVPLPPKRSGARPEAAFLYENVSFLFGVYDKPEGAAYRFQASRDKHEAVLAGCDDVAAKAVLRFFEKRTPGSTSYAGVNTPLLDDARAFVVFRLQNDPQFAHERPAVRAAWEAYCGRNNGDVPLIQCLITGEMQPLARIHGNVSGFGADKPTLVGFNQDAFCSFGKTGAQGANAPVGQKAAFEYVTALNILCQDKRRHFNLAGDKVLFWAERDAPDEEDALALLFGVRQEENAKNTEMLDESQSDRIRGILNSFVAGGQSGEAALDRNVRFYLLGISANKTRLVIRFFHDTSFGSLLENLHRHYDGLAVANMKYPYPSPYHILIETALERKRENVADNLDSALMRSILNATPYPQTLYQGVLRRIRAEAAGAEPFRVVSALRAGILKACINRQQNREVLKVALDQNERDIPYLLGRLFALMERAQYIALGELNASIADRYLNAALATPQMVFPALLELSDKHLGKHDTPEMRGKLRAVRGEIGSVMCMLDLKADASGKYAFPPSLDSNGQGKFLVGYYHQTFYKKSSEPAAPKETAAQ